MKCIIHLGPPKTGSTFIQAFLRLNKTALLEHGVLALAGSRMSSNLPYLFKSDASLVKKAERRGQTADPGRLARIRKEVHDLIQSGINEHKPDTLVLSSETLTIFKEKELKNLHRYVREFATEMEIVFFLRRPDFRATSGYKNFIRNRGMTGELGTEYKKIFDDGLTIKRLTRIFGRENITPVISKDSHPDKAAAKNHIDAMLDIIFRGVDTSEFNFTSPERRNTAWDYKAMYFMRTVNKIIADNPEYEKYRKPVGDLLQEHFNGGEKIRIQPAVAREIVAHYTGGWEFIRRQYFPDQKTLFHTDYSMYDSRQDPQEFGTEEAILVSLVLMEDILKKQDRKQRPAPKPGAS